MTPGKFAAVVVEHNFTQSQIGTRGFWVLFEVGDLKERMGTTIWLSPRAMTIARKSFKAMGFDVDRYDLMELERSNVLLNGNKVEVEVGEETYKGETKLRIKFINPAKQPLTKDESAALTHALREAKKKEGGVDEFGESEPEAASSPQPPPDPQAPADEANLPF